MIWRKGGIMEAVTFDREQAKQLIKEVLLEMLQDRGLAL